MQNPHSQNKVEGSPGATDGGKPTGHSIDPSTFTLKLDSKEPLTVRTLASLFEDLHNLMKAYGADDVQIISLHYDYEEGEA